MTEPLDVLGRARAQDYRPGQNPRDGAPGALWSLTLPNPAAVRSVLWLGVPSASDRAMLAEVMPDARLLPASDMARSGGDHDLVVVTDPGAARRLASDADAVRRLRSAFAPLGTVLIEGRGTPMLRLAARLERPSATGAAAPSLLRMFPLRGPARALLPAGDRQGLELLAARGLLRSSISEDQVAGWVRRLVRRGAGAGGPKARSAGVGSVGSGLRTARSVLRIPLRALALIEQTAATRPQMGRFLLVDGPEPGRLPSYLRSVARASGFSLPDDVVWSLVSPGDFVSQKLLWLVRRPHETEPSVVVKMAREARFSRRLHNAHRGLARLQTTPGVPTHALPRAMFSGGVAGLAITAESAVAGRPMATLGAPGPRARAVRAVVDWFEAMGSATRTWSTGPQVAAALGVLLDLLDARRILDEVEAAFLRAELEVVAAVGAPVPLVFQHGDPGVLNILTRQDGSVTLLDWENAEARGMPLWDVLYFVRSLAVATRPPGAIDRLEASLTPFLGDGALHDLLVEALTGAARRLELPAGMVRPLIFHCWVQQALKEMTRLSAEQAGGSIFLRFLRRLIAASDDPAMCRLYAIGGRLEQG